MEPNKTFESRDVIEQLVGITPIYLNAFVHREHYGIAASKSDKDAKARLFSEADVFGIALAWMLFESGLRIQAIRRVMKEIAGTKKANANKTAEVLMERRVEYVVVIREPRKPRGKAEPQPIVKTGKKADLAAVISQNPTANVLIVPVGAKLADVKKRIDVLYGE